MTNPESDLSHFLTRNLKLRKKENLKQKMDGINNAQFFPCNTFSLKSCIQIKFDILKILKGTYHLIPV